jgi:hypothetical protein
MPDENPSNPVAPIFIAVFFMIAPLAARLLLSNHDSDPAAEYERAIYDAMQPDSRVSSKLLTVDPNDPFVTVVTWTTQANVASYKTGNTPPKDTWVTITPWLKTFCQNYVKYHGSDADDLKLRLQQRLGMPPTDSSDRLVEMKVSTKDNSKFFRPCSNPSITKNNCQPVVYKNESVIDDIQKINLQDNQESTRYWFLSKYYRSYSSADQYRYPWSSLGYSFDWSRNPESGDFERWGESEFVIGPNTPITYVSDHDITSYCQP